MKKELSVAIIGGSKLIDLHKASHHILTHDKIEEILNIRSKSGKAKPYQVKQVRNILIKYKLKL